MVSRMSSGRKISPGFVDGAGADTDDVVAAPMVGVGGGENEWKRRGEADESFPAASPAGVRATAGDGAGNDASNGAGDGDHTINAIVVMRVGGY